MIVSPIRPNPYKVGDVVRLRSGSPKLTVVGVQKDSVDVAWITFDMQVPEEATYPADALVVWDKDRHL